MCSRRGPVRPQHLAPSPACCCRLVFGARTRPRQRPSRLGTLGGPRRTARGALECAPARGCAAGHFHSVPFSHVHKTQCVSPPPQGCQRRAGAVAPLGARCHFGLRRRPRHPHAAVVAFKLRTAPSIACSAIVVLVPKSPRARAPALQAPSPLWPCAQWEAAAAPHPAPCNCVQSRGVVPLSLGLGRRGRGSERLTPGHDR